MKRLIPLLFFLVFPCFAHGMTVKGYENLKLAELGKDPQIAHSALNGYFQGISDTLEGMRKDSRIDFVYQGKPTSICMPPNINLSSSLVRATLDTNFSQRGNAYDKTIPNWKTLQLAGFVMLSLAETFPCKP